MHTLRMYLRTFSAWVHPRHGRAAGFIFPHLLHATATYFYAHLLYSGEVGVAASDVASSSFLAVAHRRFRLPSTLLRASPTVACWAQVAIGNVGTMRHLAAPGKLRDLARELGVDKEIFAAFPMWQCPGFLVVATGEDGLRRMVS